MFPSEPTLFRMRRVVFSSMRMVLPVRVMSAMVPGSSRRSWNDRAAGMVDGVGGALFFEQATSAVSMSRQNGRLGFIVTPVARILSKELELLTRRYRRHTS